MNKYKKSIIVVCLLVLPAYMSAKSEYEVAFKVNHSISSTNKQVSYFAPAFFWIYKQDKVLLKTGAEAAFNYHIFDILGNQDIIEKYGNDTKLNYRFSKQFGAGVSGSLSGGRQSFFQWSGGFSLDIDPVREVSINPSLKFGEKKFRVKNAVDKTNWSNMSIGVPVSIDLNDQWSFNVNYLNYQYTISEPGYISSSESINEFGVGPGFYLPSRLYTELLLNLGFAKSSNNYIGVGLLGMVYIVKQVRLLALINYEKTYNIRKSLFGKGTSLFYYTLGIKYRF